MTRKRLTQQFPFLLPLRQFERKLFFYGHMRLDGNRYARTRADSLLPYETFFTTSPLLNYDSGFPMEYQFNKVFNLKLAVDCVDRLVIRPGETFSFWQSVRHADRDVPYKDGLNLQDGQITGSYGGGLCQLSTMLYWLFLHTPLTVTERHAHGLEQFPPTTHDLPVGTDATISEGWLDLKVRNDTPQTWQLLVNFDEENMYGAIRCNEPASELFEVYNGSITYLPDPDAPGNVKIFEHRFSFPYAKPFTKEFVDVMSIDANGIMTIETHDGSVDGPLLVSEKINLQRGSDADGRLARAKDEGILLRR